jgi:sterol 14-demethylase
VFCSNLENLLGHAAWGLVHLLQHPEHLRPIHEEVDRVLGKDTSLDWGALSKLVRLEWALKETERLAPHTPLLARQVKRACDIGGHRVPQGALVFVSPSLSHRLPDVFPDPDRYDPERFSPDRAESLAPYSLIGFGGGQHRCLGAHFSYAHAKTILGLFLRRYTASLKERAPARDTAPFTNRPVRPCFVRYQRREQA